MINVTVTLGTPLGSDLGPFALTADVGVVTPAIATRTELLDGLIVGVYDDAVEVYVQSTGVCINSLTIPITN